jgi:hypothetical protein
MPGFVRLSDSFSVPLQIIQHRHQFRHKHHPRVLLEFFRQRATDSFCQFNRSGFNANEWRKCPAGTPSGYGRRLSA